MDTQEQQLYQTMRDMRNRKSGNGRLVYDPKTRRMMAVDSDDHVGEVIRPEDAEFGRVP